MSQSWFSSAFGFTESKDFEQNRAAVAFNSATFVLTCPHAGGKRLYVGPFDCPSLGELREKVASHGLHAVGSEAHQRQRGRGGEDASGAEAGDAAAELCDEERGTLSKSGEDGRTEELRRRRLQELQAAVQHACPSAPLACPRPGGLVFGEVRGNVQDMHAMPENNGAVFMVASQVNCLEMVGPSVTPEAGITRYHDVTARAAL
jgi:hypothetical protein